MYMYIIRGMAYIHAQSSQGGNQLNSQTRGEILGEKPLPVTTTNQPAIDSYAAKVQAAKDSSNITSQEQMRVMLQLSSKFARASDDKVCYFFAELRLEMCIFGCEREVVY